MSDTTTNRFSWVRWLAFSAIMVALSTGLSYIKVWQMPMGGSVTLLSMVPICAVGLMYGPVKALPACFVYSVIQLFQGGALGWGLTPGVRVGCILFGYILPFTGMALSGLFHKKGATLSLVGVAAALVFRFACHFLTGGTIWATLEVYGNPWIYSLVYNGTYMLPELVFTLAAFALLVYTKVFDRMRRILAR